MITHIFHTELGVRQFETMVYHAARTGQRFACVVSKGIQKARMESIARAGMKISNPLLFTSPQIMRMHGMPDVPLLVVDELGLSDPRGVFMQMLYTPHTEVWMRARWGMEKLPPWTHNKAPAMPAPNIAAACAAWRMRWRACAEYELRYNFNYRNFRRGESPNDAMRRWHP